MKDANHKAAERLLCCVVSAVLLVALVEACGGYYRTPEQQQAFAEAPSHGLDLHGSWAGTSGARRWEGETVTEEWQDSIVLTLREGGFSYSSGGSVWGRGKWTADDGVLSLNDVTMVYVYRPPLNLEGRFEYDCDGELLTLYQIEPIRADKNDSPVLEKTLTLRRGSF